VQNEWTEYTEFLESGCDAALFIGMHAKAGTPDGVLSHTVSGQGWRDLRFNGVSVGETGINAALCGHWSCPVLLVTGDRATCNEAQALLGDGLTTVEVKVGLGRYSMRSKTPEDAAKSALKDLSAVRPYDPGRPCEIEIEFTFVDRLVEYRNRRGVEQIDDLTLVSKAADWWTAWSQFYF
jgi:D-amino peptidase